MRFVLTLLLALTPVSASDALRAARVGVGVVEKKLALSEAIEMALANNLDIEIQRAERDKAEQALGIARGVFDPSFRFTPGYESRNNPTGSVLQGAGGKLSESVATENFYYRQKSPWYGSSLGVDFENGRTNSSNLFSSLNPYFNSRLLISFTQPLLRGRSLDAERAGLLIRGKQRDVSREELQVRAVDVITRVQLAYWDLVAAREDVQVQADAVELAARQLAQNQRMIQSGTLAPIELSASQAEWERRKDSYYASVGVVTEVENNLKLLLLPNRRDPLWGDQFVPTDTRTAEPLEAEDVQQAVDEALRRRPEMRQTELRLQANTVEQRLNSEQTRPQVNFVASYANAGLGGALNLAENPFSASNAALYNRLNQLSAAAGFAPLPNSGFGSLPGTLVGGYGSTLSSLFGGSYQSAQAGISVDFTARNRAAKGAYTSSLIEAKRLKSVQAQAEQAIEAQVRNALQSLQTARQRIAAAEASESAAHEKLESETRLFQTGESTNFFVLTRQNEFLDARRRAVLAHLEFNKASARLEQAVGETFPKHNITLR